MKPFNLIPLIGFFCCCSLMARAQEYSYKHYDIKDGLVGNNVYQSVEDKEGFLWFATETGVSRFDGTSFKNFTTAEGLTDNEILKLFVDSKGRVWMMPFNNEVCYYYKGKVFNADNDSSLRKIKFNDRLQQICEDKYGDLIFIEAGGISVLKKDGKYLKKYDNNGKNFFCYGIGIDNNNNVLGYFSNSLETTALYYIRIRPDELLLEKKTDSIVFWGNKLSFSYFTPILFVYINNYLNQSITNSLIFDNYLKHVSDTVTSPPGFNLISFLNDSLLFFNTNHGALLYDYGRKIYVDKFLTNESVSCSIKDHEQNTWFTTLGNGIYRLLSRENKNISFIENNVRSSVEAISATKKNLIVGTGNSTVYVIDKQGNKTNSFVVRSEESLKKVIKIIAFKNNIYVLGENSFNKFNDDLGKIDEISIEGLKRGSGLKNKNIWIYKDVAITDSGNAFFATHIQTFSSHIEKKNPDYDVSLYERSTAVCLADSGLYIGTLKGLLFINRDKKLFDLSTTDSLLSNRITKIVFSKGKIWIGTNDQGLICLNRKKTEKNITIKDGLTGNLIRSLFADSNYLWVGTDRGLNKIDLTDTSYRVLQQYTTSDGLASNMINTAYVQNDTVYIGTPRGLNYFDDRKINGSSTCDIKILDIVVSGKNIQFDSSNLSLKNKDNNIRFDFVAISFKSEGNILYYYKLSGIDSAWETTKENFLQYPTLPSGKYTFELYAVNKFGVKSKTVTINFEIEKKLSEETWFIILLILLAIISAMLLANWRIRRLKNSQKQKMANSEKIATLEQQALKAQMNPHFIFNCLNSIQQYVIDKDIQGANKFISGFSKLIRQTLDNSGKQTITVAEEESFLRSYLELEKSRFEDKFDYVIRIDQNINKDEDSLPPMLLQPYIENCIRHGIMHKSNGKGMIEVLFTLSEGKLVCSVADNGIGRIAADTYKGMQHINYQSKGTDLTGQRIVMINKSNHTDIVLKTEDLTDSEKQPSGTKVTIVIPLQNVD